MLLIIQNMTILIIHICYFISYYQTLTRLSLFPFPFLVFLLAYTFDTKDVIL